MKKIFLLFILAFGISTLVSAQGLIYQMDFEEVPANWGVATSTPIELRQSWALGESGDLSSDGFMIPEHTTFVATNDDMYEDANKIGDTLYSPLFNFNNIQGLKLSFDAFFLGKTNGRIKETAEVWVLHRRRTWTKVYDIKGIDTWQDKIVVDLSQYTDSLAIVFIYSDGGGKMGGLALDNFKLYTQNKGIDLRFANVFGLQEFWKIDSAIVLDGRVENVGEEPITRFDVSWYVQSMTTRDTVSRGKFTITPPKPILTTEFYDFDFAEAPMLSSLDSFLVHFRVSQVNGIDEGDGQLANNTLIGTVTSTSFTPIRSVVIENLTSTYFQLAPLTDYFLKDVEDNRKNVIIINNHVNVGAQGGGVLRDPMNYDAGAILFNQLGIRSLPAVLFDRSVVSTFTQGNQVFFNQFSSILQTTAFRADSVISPATVTIEEAKFNETTRDLTVTVKSTWFTNINNTFAVNCLLTEDKLVYPQIIYPNFTTAETLPYMVTPSNPTGRNPYYGAPTTISTYTHNNVLRAYMALSVQPWFGERVESGTNVIYDGESYYHTFTYRVPDSLNARNLNIVATVQRDFATRRGSRIYDAQKKSFAELKLVSRTDYGSEELANEVRVYPIPTKGTLYIQNANAIALKADVINVSGQVVKSAQFNSYINEINLDELPAGVYMLKLNDGVREMVQKIILN